MVFFCCSLSLVFFSSNKISSDIDYVYKCGYFVGYLVLDFSVYLSFCDLFFCLFYNCMLLNLSFVVKILNLDMERDIRDFFVYV